ncbi:hypothetical protein ABB37_07808 [Leptomonas pyrrhocoris]|uniref:Uncharacterized protein n=1 Tax=Leptomonas pyrrhocoris TaxID=157538 RepID=A0A0M9FV03_LEPPY|nr:hypothetical protein ABB37_07808 [Leptomonas pyrrhocoris]XP_015654947.1 hypothetical protein ABB37_07808 [Leptomonas pyrrhocoris]KPA76507.1 hypothetical protein ABB37_07808 [Leptomonas pyrrhocoris]KPA76508.1 hypothetical protein ABB37_07808 [Leptomonas pyrrhocoris]|eukprot:XP_015654946.1 hypothetical protein ABB37_07808 [Leptomonas pyrrhocoris]
MQSDLTNVEAELHDIEVAFATGRMNAFGSASTQDAFVQELRRIAEIETQVFYRTCALLKSSNTDEHALVTNMYASAQPPPQSQRAAANGTNFGNSSIVLDSSALFRSGNPALAPRSSFTAVPSSSTNVGRSGMLSPGVSRPQSRNGRESIVGATPGPFGVMSDSSLGTASAAPHIHQSEWGNEDGFADKAFEDVAAHFDELESQFTSLGDYLRDISKHVIRLNDMSEQVNTGTNGGGVFNPAVVNLNATTQSNAQSSSSGGRRARTDSFEEEGGTSRFDGVAFSQTKGN